MAAIGHGGSSNARCGSHGGCSKIYRGKVHAGVGWYAKCSQLHQHYPNLAYAWGRKLMGFDGVSDELGSTV